MDNYAPCPTCSQYSHSIGEDQLAAAFRHFESMIAHPVRGHPMGYAFDEATRNHAQVLMAAARTPSRNDVLEEAALIAEGCPSVLICSTPRHAQKEIAAAIRARKDQTDG